GGETGGEESKRLDRANEQHTGELPGEERRSAHGSQRKPVEEAGVDVLRDVRARGVRGEDLPLHEREGEHECEIRVGGKARNPRRRVEAGRIYRQQKEREDQRRNDHDRLTYGPNDRAPSEI